MNSINVVAMTGNLATDPELRKSPLGTPVTTLRLANNVRRRAGDGWADKTSYFDIEVWGAQAAACVENLARGARIGVQGEIEIDQWTDTSGERRSKAVIRQASVTFERRRLRALEDQAPASDDGVTTGIMA
jgi:single-strand DNA-binding protein